MFNIKFKALYSNECYRLANRIERIFSFVLAFVSTSSVATWAFWNKYPLVWAWIVGISQILTIAKNYFPFIKNEKDFLEMSFEFEILYIEYEKLWFDNEYEVIEKENAEFIFYKLREREIEIEKIYKQSQCPKIKHIMARVYKEVETAINLNFF